MLHTKLVYLIFFISFNVIYSENVITTTEQIVSGNISSIGKEPIKDASQVGSQTSEIDFVQENILTHAMVWLNKTKDVRQTIKHKTEAGFQEAVKNLTQVGEDLLTEKKDSAKTWIDSNCAKYEQETFNESIVDACYKDDENIQKLESTNKQYMDCVIELMSELEQLDKQLDASVESFEKRVLDKNLSSVDTAKSLMYNIDRLTQRQLDLLRDFSFSSVEIHEEPITTTDYYGRYKNLNTTQKPKYVKKVIFFNSKCYKQFNYDKYLTPDAFKLFLRCIVKKTCDDESYRRYIDQE